MKFYIISHALVLFVVLVSLPVFSQEKENVLADGTQGEILITPDSINHAPKKTTWRQFNLGFTTLKVGMGMLYDVAAFSQDANNKIQMDSSGNVLEAGDKLRDFRFLVSGKIKMKREFTWKMGVMYDAPTSSWLWRETGIMVGVPEIKSHFFVGRTKEGFSMNKVMVGYAGLTPERQMALDVIPILADGIKWLGYLPKQKVLWNFGVYTDWLSEGQSFSTYQWQTAARIAWLPVFDTKKDKLIHIGMNFRYGVPYQHQMRLRSRPEAIVAPYFIDTDKFPADKSFHVGPELYYSNGPLMLGSEYFFHTFYQPGGNKITFNGGEAIASYFLTGEHRPYSTVTGIFSFVDVKKPVFKGGFGAVELLLRVSHLDLADGDIDGGKLWRITPMVNWYLTQNFRLELVYGYSQLDRYQLKGATNIYQARIQLAVL